MYLPTGTSSTAPREHTVARPRRSMLSQSSHDVKRLPNFLVLAQYLEIKYSNMSADDDGTGDVTMADPRNPGGDAEFEEIREQVRVSRVSKKRRFLLLSDYSSS